MDLNHFTTKSQEVISNAQELTLTNGNQAIENTHILSAIIEVDQNVFPHVSKKLGANPNIITKANDSILQSLPKVSGGNIHLSNNTQK
ncbi:type VI secretion system ATPase TssH, partial [Bacteroidota bacterium]|nr:type VI secretion system ATPase TssH [Bacteroidota bacterium]